MVCTHLKQLYELCETHQLKMAGSDLIRIVCKTCNEHEICPSMLMDEYDARYKAETETHPVVELQIHPKPMGK